MIKTKTIPKSILKKYFVIGKYFGEFYMEQKDAPSIADAEEILDLNEGQSVIATEEEMRRLYNSLTRFFGNPKYTKEQILELKSSIGFACKNGFLDEETGEEFLWDLDKGFRWLESGTC
jgi:hypothetical protein